MSSDKPVKNASGRYDNVDFRKAAGYEYPPIKCSYNRRDVLLFVRMLPIPICFLATHDHEMTDSWVLPRPMQSVSRRTNATSCMNCTLALRRSRHFLSISPSSKQTRMYLTSSHGRHLVLCRARRHSMHSDRSMANVGSKWSRKSRRAQKVLTWKSEARLSVYMIKVGLSLNHDSLSPQYSTDGYK